MERDDVSLDLDIDVALIPADELFADLTAESLHNNLTEFRESIWASHSQATRLPSYRTLMAGIAIYLRPEVSWPYAHTSVHRTGVHSTA